MDEEAEEEDDDEDEEDEEEEDDDDRDGEWAPSCRSCSNSSPKISTSCSEKSIFDQSVSLLGAGNFMCIG